LLDSLLQENDVLIENDPRGKTSFRTAGTPL